MFHYLLGYEKDLTDKLNISLEAGKYHISPVYPEGDYQNNILPISAFTSLISSYEFSDKNSIQLNYVFDTESHFSFAHSSYKYLISDNMNISIFASTRASKAKDEIKYNSQNLIPTQAGVNFKISL